MAEEMATYRGRDWRTAAGVHSDRGGKRRPCIVVVEPSVASTT